MFLLLLLVELTDLCCNGSIEILNGVQLNSWLRSLFGKNWTAIAFHTVVLSRFPSEMVTFPDMTY